MGTPDRRTVTRPAAAMQTGAVRVAVAVVVGVRVLMGRGSAADAGGWVRAVLCTVTAAEQYMQALAVRVTIAIFVGVHVLVGLRPAAGAVTAVGTAGGGAVAVRAFGVHTLAIAVAVAVTV